MIHLWWHRCDGKSLNKVTHPNDTLHRGRSFLGRTRQGSLPFILSISNVLRDLPIAPRQEWIVTQWQKAQASDPQATLLAMYEIQKVPHWSSVVKTRSNGFGTRRAASPVSRTKKISYQDIVKSTHSMASGDDNKDPSLNWTLLQCGIFRNSRRHKGHPLFFKISDGG